MLPRCFVNVWRQHGSWMERDRLKLNLGKAKWVIWGSCTQLPFAFQNFGMTIGLELNIYVAVLTRTHEKSIHILQGYFSGQTRSITKCLANIINPLLLPLKNKINISEVFYWTIKQNISFMIDTIWHIMFWSHENPELYAVKLFLYYVTLSILNV